MPRISAKPTREEEIMDAAPVAVLEPPTPPSPHVTIIERRIETFKVAIPVGETKRPFHEAHIEGWLRGPTAQTFCGLRQALQDLGKMTNDGRPVKSNVDVMRWILEQVMSGQQC